MNKKDIFIRLACLLFTISLGCCTVAGCNNGEGTNSSRKNTSAVSSYADSSSAVDSSESSDTVSSGDETDSENSTSSTAPDDASSAAESEDIDLNDLPEGNIDENKEADYLKVSISNKTAVSNSFLGLNGVYHIFPYMPDKLGIQYTEAQAKLELDRLESMGLDIIRSSYSADWSWNTVTKTRDWDTPKMKGFWRGCKELQDRGIDIALAFAGLYNLEAGGGSDSGLYVAGDRAQTMNNFGEYMTESLKEAKKRGINNIKYIIVWTEPDNAFPGKSHSDENVEATFAAYEASIKALDSHLKAAGIRNNYKLIGPNTNSAVLRSFEISHLTNAPMLKLAVEKLNNYIDIYGDHPGYPFSNDMTDDAFYSHTADLLPYRLSLVKTTGKSFWYDEWNVLTTGSNYPQTLKSEWSGTQRAASLVAAMNLGVDNLFMWSICDQQYPDNHASNSPATFVNGMHRIGVLPSLLLSSIPNPAYYATALLTKYTGKGSTFAAAAEYDFAGVYASCQQMEDGNWTAIVVNAGLVDSPISLEFEKAIGKTFYRHSYDPTNVKPTAQAKVPLADKRYTNVSNKIIDTLSGGMVAVYTTIK